MNYRYILVGVSLSALLLASVVAGVVVSGRNARIASLRQELSDEQRRQQEANKNLSKAEADLRAALDAGAGQTAKYKKERAGLYSWDELEPCVDAAGYADSFASMMSYATEIEPVTLARFAEAKRLCDRLSEKHDQAQGKKADEGD